MIRSGQERAARKRYREMAPVLNEQSLRRFVALEAQALGRGGVSLMARISGLARSTIDHGISDIRDNDKEDIVSTLGINAGVVRSDTLAPRIYRQPNK